MQKAGLQIFQFALSSHVAGDRLLSNRAHNRSWLRKQRDQGLGIKFPIPGELLYISTKTL